MSGHVEHNKIIWQTQCLIGIDSHLGNQQNQNPNKKIIIRKKTKQNKTQKKQKKKQKDRLAVKQSFRNCHGVE